MKFIKADIKFFEATIIFGLNAGEVRDFDRVAALGAAPSPVLKRRLTAESLASAIVTALRDPRFAAGAEAVARKLSREDGAERTAEWVEQSFGGR